LALFNNSGKDSGYVLKTKNGVVELAGLDDITVNSGTAIVEVNNTGTEINNLTVAGIDLSFSSDIQHISITSFVILISDYLTINADFSFVKNSNKILASSNNSLATFDLGNNIAKISNVNIGWLINSDGYALYATGSLNVSETSIIDLSVNNVEIKINNTNSVVSESFKNGIILSFVEGEEKIYTVYAENVSLDILDIFTIDAKSIYFEKSGSDLNLKTLITIVEANLFLGTIDGETKIGLGSSISLIGVVLYDGVSGLAISSSSGTIETFGFEDLFFYGSLGLSVNTTGKVVDENFGDISISYETTNNVVLILGQVSVNVSDFVTLNGSFSFDKQSDLGNTVIVINTFNANVLIGNPELSVQALNINLSATIYLSTGKFAMAATANDFYINGLPERALSGDNLQVQYNNTSSTQTLILNDTTVSVASGSSEFSGTDLVFSVSEFVELRGNFSFSKVGTDSDTEIQIGATDVSAFIGSGEGTEAAFGISLGNGALALVLYQGISTNSYALDMTGDVSLVIGDGSELGIDAGATASVRVNTTGMAIEQTINGVDLSFTDGVFVQSIVATGLSLNIANFATLTGDFSFTQTGPPGETQLLIGAMNVSAALGSSDFGVSLSDGTLGLVIYQQDDSTSTYALR